MKLLSTATPADFSHLAQLTQNLPQSDNLQNAAQAFIDVIYDYFRESIILLRMFTTVSYSELSPTDKQLVDKKGIDTGTANLINNDTPVLTLLGTRGRNEDWNDRAKSKRFRCIPLPSAAYVGGLSMLSMQFRVMSLDLALFDSWGADFVAKGGADKYSGMLYIPDSAADKDEKGRMAVPAQDFVMENSVKTTLGFGSGYSHHPALLTLFVFANETLDADDKGFAGLLEMFKSITGEHVARRRIFS